MPVLPRLAGLLLAFAPAAWAAGDFRAACQAAVAGAGDTFVVTGRDGWLYPTSEFKHLATDPAAWPAPGADPAGVVADVAAQMKSAGVDFLVMPIPAKVLVQAAGLPEAFAGLAPADPVLDAFLAAVRAKGVEALDLRAVWPRDPGRAFFCRQDTHWNGEGLGLAAAALAEFAKSRPWFGAAPKRIPAVEPLELEIQGDLWVQLKPPAPPREVVKLQRAPGVDGSAPDSSVLFMGDSSVLVFSGGGDLHTTGCGLAEAFAVASGIAPQVLGQRGSGHAQILNLKRGGRDAKILPAKKMVAWIFTCTELTQASAWKSYPLKFK